MNKNEVLKEHHIAKKASVSAGELLLNKNLISEIFSSDKDIKLTADIQAEQSIKDIISAESPYPILAEESGKSVEKLGDTYWIIDPLDGTANYSRSIPISAVSICLMHQLNPVLGVIYDFNNDHLYEGSIVSDALLNDQKIKVSSVDNSESGILITGLPNNTDYSDKALTKMIRDFQDWRKVRMLGSAAMAAAFIASGKADVYKEKNSYIWDVAAGAAIVKAAGGYVSLTNQNESFQVDVFFSNGHILG
jgi:myo-inositol-1(or 4)-monophosphatase